MNTHFGEVEVWADRDNPRQVVFENKVKRLPESWIGYNGIDLMILGTPDRAGEFARTLLDRSLVHFIASDGHDLKHLGDTLAQRDHIARSLGPDQAALLVKTQGRGGDAAPA